MARARPHPSLLLAIGTILAACGRSPAEPTHPPPTGLGPPQNLVLNISGPTQALGFSARLTWSPPASDPVPTAYQVELATSPGFATVARTRVNGTSASFDYPVPRRSWSWRVRAIDGTTEGPVSNVVSYVFALPDPQTTLPAPIPISPPDRAVFDLFPRATTLSWTAVLGAASYGFEIDYCQPSNPWCADESRTEVHVTSAHPTGQAPYVSPTYAFDFIGAQPGRWTVWAIDTQGRMGARSPWQAFVYLR